MEIIFFKFIPFVFVSFLQHRYLIGLKDEQVEADNQVRSSYIGIMYMFNTNLRVFPNKAILRS